VHLNQATLPTDDVMRIGALFHVVNDIERIGDHAENVADASVQMIDDEVVFSKQGERDLSDMLDMVLKILDYSIEMFAKDDRQHVQEVMDLENSIDQEERDLQQKHVERLTRNECTPEAGMIFSDLISGLERVADHSTNIAFSILDEDPEDAAATENGTAG
ncbi:MAG: PhoU domain-containing protein, partial [Lachnospiraceae bacterium]|nr:PhoU domain-containing protein [Lachnospiraceae bacterium]